MIVSLATRWRVSSDSGNLKIELRQPKAKFDMPIARKLGVLCAALLIFSFWAKMSATEPCGVPASGPEWPAAAAESPAFDAARLCDLASMLSLSDTGIHAVLVLRKGTLVFEQYRTARDIPWGKDPGIYTYDAATRHDIRSISKSVVSLLVGMAVDRQMIGSVDDRVFDYLPQYADLRTAEKSHITIADLLSMRSGFVANEVVGYEDPNNTERLMNEAADPYRFVLERKMLTSPGLAWTYDGGNTMLLSAVLKKVTAKPLLEFATEALFEPLGIADFEWIPLRKSGEIAAQGSLRLRPRDLAKIGQLVLDNGRWQGKQFVSEHWIAESTRPRVEGWYPGRYGHHWWTGQSSAPDGAMVDWIAGIGMGGQRLFIVPKFDLVVVINAWVTNPDQRSVGIDILDNYVLAAIRN